MALVVLAVGCGEDDPADDGAERALSPTVGSTGGARRDTPRYVLLDRSDWRLDEALDYRAGLGQLGELEPSLDWYAEYDGPRIDHGDGSFTIPAVRISGHTASLEQRGDELPGAEFQPVDVAGRRGLFAEPDAGNPAVVVIELAPTYTVTILSYDDVVDLRDLAADVIPVDEREWVAAGGTMTECAPMDPGCARDGERQSREARHG